MITQDSIGKDKTVLIYGYSQSYGQPNHSVAAEMIKEAFNEYAASDITWNNEGY